MLNFQGRSSIGAEVSEDCFGSISQLLDFNISDGFLSSWKCFKVLCSSCDSAGFFEDFSRVNATCGPEKCRTLA